MSKGLYLGKVLTPGAKELGPRLSLDPADLLTHGLIVGMTGSGKTGLAIALIEEVLGQGIPVLAIDPKGDLGNLLLLFEDLAPESFEPWVDPEAARRDGQDLKTAAAEAAASWTKGLAEWGLGAADIVALKRSHDAVIYTPGSRAGIPLNVLQSLDAPSEPFESAAEDLRDEIAGIVAGLLGLVKIAADPLQSRESIFLSNLIESSWRAGKGLSLEALISAVADPPFDKVGALPLETVFPRKDRQGLMMALNNLLAAPSFESWREGEPLDVGAMLRTKDGRPRLSIVSTAHLSDEERLFVTALLLDKVKTWMRGQAGTSELRALVYMDEIFGYFPPHPANPPTKRPLLTLLKQARAQGVGVMLATQNPVDLDYKGLANMGAWMVGTLQTEQDRARLREGLTTVGVDASTVDRLLDATRKRVFLLHDIHRAGPCLLHSRWAMSYLRGPLTREEISRLMAGRSTAASPKPLAASPAGSAPVLPPPFKHSYLSKYGAELADPFLLVKYAVRYKGTAEVIATRGYPLAVAGVAEILEADPIELDERALTATAPAGIRYSDLPAYLAAAGAKGIEKALKDRLADKLAVTVYSDPVTKEASEPGEDRAAFAARLTASAGGSAAERLQDKMDKKQRDLAAREADLSGRKTEKWTALGSAVLQNIGLFTGRKRTISGAGTVLSKNRMENNAEARVEALRAEVEELKRQLAEAQTVDPARFEEETVVPARTAVKILRYDLVWIC
jgi:hypothetical protein